MEHVLANVGGVSKVAREKTLTLKFDVCEMKQ